MSFIAKNPLSVPEIEHTPSTPPGTRGLFAKEDGWYEVDDQGHVKKIGANGTEGADGKSAYEIALDYGFEGSEEEWLESLQGEKGEPGKDGVNGQDGLDGKDGISATHSWNGTVLTVTSASGTSSANLKGDKGDKGDSYILTESDKTKISDIVSSEIEAELNAALQEIIDIQEDAMTPDGDEVKY